MEIFLLEYVTGGGLLQRAEPGGSLLVEGLAMVRALSSDLARIADVDVHLLWDVRLSDLGWDFAPNVHRHRVRRWDEHLQTIERLATRAEWSFLIAPELDGVLYQYAERLQSLGARSAGPAPDWIALASDKSATCERLRQAGVPTPAGRLFESDALGCLSDVESCSELGAFPLVLKRNDGAGSEGICRIGSREDWLKRTRARLPQRWASGPDAGSIPTSNGAASPALRIERFVPGLAASVAVLAGPAGCVPLPAMGQRLSGDGRMRYLGGWLVRDAELQRRARRLAVAAIRALPGARGYVGCDMILGREADGSGDAVIEVNPRLTTSYIGLRRVLPQNLAETWLDVIGGKLPDVTHCDRELHFTAAGEEL